MLVDDARLMLIVDEATAMLREQLGDNTKFVMLVVRDGYPVRVRGNFSRDHLPFLLRHVADGLDAQDFIDVTASERGS